MSNQNCDCISSDICKCNARFFAGKNLRKRNNTTDLAPNMICELGDYKCSKPGK